MTVHIFDDTGGREPKKCLCGCPVDDNSLSIIDDAGAQDGSVPGMPLADCVPCLRAVWALLYNAWADFIVIEESELADATHALARLRKRVRIIHEAQKRRQRGKRRA